MRWKGFLLLFVLLLLLGAPTDELQPVSGEAEIYEDTEARMKYVALTFDDGPRRKTTTQLLDGLYQRGANATFFLIGKQIPGNEDLVQRMLAEGHQVGNHTYSHVCLQEISQTEGARELAQTDTLLQKVLGKGEYWIRPPYGLIEPEKRDQIQVPMIQWSVDPEDWKLKNTEKVLNALLSCVEDRDIILLHDIYLSSVEAALELVDILQGRGYVFVTVEELFLICGMEAEAGILYATPERLYPY